MTAREVDVVYTDACGNDVGVLDGCTVEVAYGADEQRLTATCPIGTVIEPGAYVYVPDTEWGGIVDDEDVDSGEMRVVYGGRTWHGVLAGKVLSPRDGEDHIVMDGDANACLAEIVERADLGSLFSVDPLPSGIAVDGYELARFTDAWSGIRAMLASAGARPELAFGGKTVRIRAVAAVDWSDAEDFDGDRAAVRIKRSWRSVNHLVCAGEGELGERVVVHLYADADGNVSRTQTFFGADEVSELYSYTSADEEQLVENGTKRLEDLQDGGSASVTVEPGAYAIGDTVGAVDPHGGSSVTAVIEKLIVSIEEGVPRIEYKTGDAAQRAAQAAKAMGLR